MSDADFERWEEIVDREALGEPISAADATFRRNFERKHPLCARESTAWDAMLGTLAHAHSSDLDTGRQQLIDSVLAGVDREQVPATATVVSFSRRRRGVWAAACVAAAASLAIAVWPDDDAVQTVASTQNLASPSPQAAVSPPAPERPVPLPAVTPAPTFEPPRVTFVGRADSVGVVGSPLAHNRLETSDADLCFVYQQPFAAVCVSEGSRFSLHENAEGRRIELEAGRVVANLDKLPEGKSFVVQSPTTSATAIGTIFEVTHADVGSRVAVLEGEVGVQQSDAAPIHVHANMMLRHGEAAPVATTDVGWSQARAQLGELWRGHGAEALVGLQLPRPDKADSVLLDDLALGSSALAIATPAGNHQLTVRGRGSSASQSLALEAGRPLRVAQLPSLAQQPVSKKHGTSPQAALADLKAQARTARASRDWSRAAALLKKLIETAPNSATAQTARVQLGDLLLRHLANPSGALSAYRGYLEHGGTLALEARHGEIQALRALGRSAAEKAAIQRFLTAFPNSLEAKTLRKRLEAL